MKNESLSHDRDESSEHLCILAWISAKGCAVVVGGVSLCAGFWSLCSDVYRPQESPGCSIASG